MVEPGPAPHGRHPDDELAVGGGLGGDRSADGSVDAAAPVPGSAGPLTRIVEALPDGRRLTRYQTTDGR